PVATSALLAPDPMPAQPRTVATAATSFHRFLSPGRTIHYVATITPGSPDWQVRRVIMLLPRRAASSQPQPPRPHQGESGLLRLALGDELPGGAGLEAPGRGRERGQHEEHERNDVHAGAVEADPSDGEQLGVGQ